MDTGATDKRITTVETLFIAAVICYALWSLYQIIQTTAPDFLGYFGAVASVSKTPYAVPPNLLPPVSRIVYWPIGLLPYQLSQAIWVLVSVFCLWVSVRWMLCRLGNHTDRDALFFSSVAFLSFPTRFTLGMGQVNLIVLAFMIAAVAAETRKQSFNGGILWTIAMLFKPELALLFFVFLLARRWKFCLYSALSSVAAVGASLLFWGMGAYKVYSSRMASEFGILRGRESYYNQSLSGIIARLGLHPSSVFIYICLTIIITGFFFWLVIYKKVKFPTVIWFALPIFLIIEPIAWQHHLVFTIPAFMFVWEKMKKMGSSKLYGIFWISYLLVSWNIKNPVYWQQSPVAALVLSHGFIGVILVWVLALIFL